MAERETPKTSNPLPPVPEMDQERKKALFEMMRKQRELAEKYREKK